MSSSASSSFSLVGFQKCQHLAEYLSGVASVDFLDDYDIFGSRVSFRGVNHLDDERAVHQFEFAVRAWSVSPYEILIG